MKWYFPPLLPSQVETEITQRDQFSNDDVQLSETIVRESIQNSLDASIEDTSGVKVTFRWMDQTNGLDKNFISKIFDKQLAHAEAAGISSSNIDFDQPTALIIEDFGTKGLTGDVNEKDNDNFSDFWRRHGKSHKTGKNRGRWGLGKLVYSTTSQLGVFFGATLRAGDPLVHVMGQTVLNLHEVDGKKFLPHGFFSDIEGGEDIYTQIPVPLKDESIVNEFINQFSLERADQPGLSVVIPFPNTDFRPESMIGVAIANYFYPLITGQLTLKFDDIEINSGNIRELAHEYAASNFHDVDMLFDFIEESQRVKDEDMLTLKPSWADDNTLDENDIDPDDLDVIRERFGNEKNIALRLPIMIKKKDGSQLESYFSVFIKRPKQLSKGLDLYVRGGLTLPGEAKFKERKALGAMIAEDEVICSFLGDAENAAHTQWVAGSEKIRKNYQNPRRIVMVIKKVIVDLYDLLAEVTDEIDEQALSSFFWMDEPEGTKAKKKPKKTPVVITPPPEPRPKKYYINKTKDGFSITNTNEAVFEHFPQVIQVKVAYDVYSGNPFKKYNPIDFTFGTKSKLKFSFAGKSTNLIYRKENTMNVEISELPFKVIVEGFDTNRDLKIDLKEV